MKNVSQSVFRSKYDNHTDYCLKTRGDQWNEFTWKYKIYREADQANCLISVILNV